MVIPDLMFNHNGLCQCRKAYTQGFSCIEEFLAPPKEVLASAKIIGFENKNSNSNLVRMSFTACFKFSPLNPSFLQFLFFGTNGNRVHKQVISILNILTSYLWVHFVSCRKFPVIAQRDLLTVELELKVTARSFLEDSLRIRSTVRSFSKEIQFRFYV